MQGCSQPCRSRTDGRLAKRRALFSDPPRVTILLGDQADADFWATVAKEHPDGFDIILDDGGM